MIDAFKELIMEDKIAGDVVICASVSSADIIGFIDTEEERWNKAKRRGKTTAVAGGGAAAIAAPESFVSELLPLGVRAPTNPGELLPLLPRVLPLYLSHFLSLHELESVDVLLLEPPSVNLNAEKVPDASFAWMGGVDSSLTVSEDGFVAFAAHWFEQLERAQRAGQIKSYGLSSARITMMPYAAELAPEAAAKEAQAAKAADLPPAPAAPHGSKFYVPLQRIIDAARDASAKVGPAATDATAEQGSQPKDHHLTTLKFPFSLFNAHKLLFPPSSSGGPSFFEQTRAAGLLCLGDLPLDDSEPRFNEWIRFQECPSQDSKNLLKHYRESMQKITNLEYVYKLLVEESGLPAEALPPRIPDFSWGGLIHSHQNDVYNIVTWESLLHHRIRPSLQLSVARLKALGGAHPKLADWASRYAQAAPEACKRFQHAVEHTTAILNEKINERLVGAVGRLVAFPSLEEKALLILLSTPIHAVITDQTASVHLLAQSLSRAHDKRRAEGKDDDATAAAAGTGLGDRDVGAVPVSVTSALRPFLLTPAELRTVLDMLQSEVAAILPVRVMMDDLRKKKPATLR